jgi:hypothetical protein
MSVDWKNLVIAVVAGDRREQELGLKFVWARGMGMRAPKTVGTSQWEGIRRRIESIGRLQTCQS